MQLVEQGAKGFALGDGTGRAQFEHATARKTLQDAFRIEFVDGAPDVPRCVFQVGRGAVVECDRGRLAFDDQPRLAHEPRHTIGEQFGHVHRVVGGRVVVGTQGLGAAAAGHEAALHAVIAQVHDAAYAHARRDIGRRAARQHRHVHAGHSGQRPQSTPAEGQDGRPPRIIDDATERAIEVTDHQQRTARKVLHGRVQRRRDADGRRHEPGLGVAPVRMSPSAWSKTSGGAPPNTICWTTPLPSMK